MNRNLEIAVGSVLAEPPPPQMLAEFDGWVKKEIGEQAASISSVAEYRRLWQGWASQTSFIKLDQPLSKLGGLRVERTLGSSKLTETVEIAEKHLFRPGSIFLGRSIEFDILQAGTSPEKTSAPLGHVGEGHGLVVADTRFGKLVRVLQPTISTWPGSLVAIDNSGELASINAERRGHGNPDHCEGLGQDVFVLDPQNATNVPDQYRATWNPLDCLNLEDPECIDKAETLADALLPQEQETSDPYWKDEGKAFIAALFIYVATSERFTSCGENTLNTVYALMSAGDEDLLNRLRKDGVFASEEGDPLQLLFSEMKTTLGPNYVSLKGKHLNQLYVGARKQWEGIRSQAQSALSWVEKPTMKGCLASSSFSFADLKTNPNGMSVFISLKDLSSEWRWIRMVLSMLAVQSKTYDEPATGHSTLVVVDEFPKLKPMPVILDFLDCMAKHRVRMLIVCQSIDQLEEVYPKSWHRFFAAADIRWFFGAESHRTRKFLEDELGQTEIMRLTRSQAEAIGYSTNSSMSASENQSQNASTARSVSQNDTWSQGSSEGTSENWGSGWSRGDSYKESILGLVPWLNRVPLLKGAERSRGRNGSIGGGSSAGTSSSAGGGSSVSETQTEGTSSGTGRSQTTGGSEQFTGTQTISETLHKGPVIQAADLPYVIADVDDPNDPRYPGQALVSVRGGVRFLVRTTRYFEDPMLYRCFGKHPAHPFKQAKIPWHIWAALDYKDRMIWEEMKRRANAQREARDTHRDQLMNIAVDSLIETVEKYALRCKKPQQCTPWCSLSIDELRRWTKANPQEEILPLKVEVSSGLITKGDVLARLTTGQPVVVSPQDGNVISVEESGNEVKFHFRFELAPIPVPEWVTRLKIDRENSSLFLDKIAENFDSHPAIAVMVEAKTLQHRVLPELESNGCSELYPGMKSAQWSKQAVYDEECRLGSMALQPYLAFQSEFDAYFRQSNEFVIRPWTQVKHWLACYKNFVVLGVQRLPINLRWLVGSSVYGLAFFLLPIFLFFTVTNFFSLLFLAPDFESLAATFRKRNSQDLSRHLEKGGATFFRHYPDDEEFASYPTEFNDWVELSLIDIKYRNQLDWTPKPPEQIAAELELRSNFEKTTGWRLFSDADKAAFNKSLPNRQGMERPASTKTMEVVSLIGSETHVFVRPKNYQSNLRNAFREREDAVVANLDEQRRSLIKYRFGVFALLGAVASIIFRFCKRNILQPPPHPLSLKSNIAQTYGDGFP